MSACADAMSQLLSLKSEEGETAYNLASRMYFLQMEVLSANAGRDLYSWDDFERLTPDVKASWLLAARKKMATQGASSV